MVLALAAAVIRGRAVRRAASVRLWLGPALAVIGLVLIYPIFDLVRLAFSDAHTAEAATRYTPARASRICSRDPEFYAAWSRSPLIFVVASVALQLGLGLLLAWLTRRGAPARGGPAPCSRALAVVSAWVIPGVLVGVLWKILLVENRSGIVNYFLSCFGVRSAARCCRHPHSRWCR